MKIITTLFLIASVQSFELNIITNDQIGKINYDSEFLSLTGNWTDHNMSFIMETNPYTKFIMNGSWTSNKFLFNLQGPMYQMLNVNTTILDDDVVIIYWHL